MPFKTRTSKSISDLNLSNKHKSQLERACQRGSNAFMERYILPTISGFLSNNLNGMPHLFAKESGAFAHQDMIDFGLETHPVTGRIPYQFTLFTNPLDNAEYDQRSAVPGKRSGWTPPSERVANAGWCVFTFEFDGGSSEDLEMQLDWFAGKSENCPFHAVHKALSAFPDYRGYCAVFSGNKSIHIHIIFATNHLSKHVPTGKNTKSKQIWQGDLPDKFLSELHRHAWTKIAEIINLNLETDVQFDTFLRNYVQKRRLPWGIRQFTKPSDLHGFNIGDEIEQIVVQENVLTRSPKQSGGTPLISAEGFNSLAAAERTASRKPSPSYIATDQQPRVLDDFRMYLMSNGWAEYPKPATLHHDGSFNVVHFFNDEQDCNPSTFVRGDNRMLVGGGKAAPALGVFLPNDLSLDDTLSLLAPNQLKRIEGTSARKSRKNALASVRFKEDATNLKQARAVLAPLLDNVARLPGTTMVQALEGIGKTYLLLSVATEVNWDQDAARYRQARFNRTEFSPAKGFVALACKSYAQCSSKAKEFAKMPSGPSNIVMMKSLSLIYKDALNGFPDESEISRQRAGELGYPNLIQAIKNEQPDIFKMMTEIRDAMWPQIDGVAQFDPCAFVVLVHSVLQNWPHSLYAKAFLHPDFPDDLDPDAISKCAAQMTMKRVIYDEVEWQDLVSLYPRWMVQLAKDAETQCQSQAKAEWEEAPLSDRVSAFNLSMVNEGSPDMSYDTCDAIIRAGLTEADRYSIDASRFPFGKGTNENNIYAQCDGKEYYVKERRWWKSLNCPVVILTTEDLPRLVAKGINSVQANMPSTPREIITIFNLTDAPHLIHETVQLRFDERVRMPRSDDKPSVINMAHDLLAGDVGYIISNGIPRDDPRFDGKVSSHKDARGRNDLSDKKIATFVTYPGVSEFEEYCALGMCFDIDNPISIAYRDMIFQDLGRNLGCRGGLAQDSAVHTVWIKSSLFRDLDRFKGESIKGAGYDRYQFRLVPQ